MHYVASEKILICISHILEVRKVCVYICVYEVMEQFTRPPPLLTPIANSGVPKTTLAFHNSLEGFTEFTIIFIIFFFLQ